MIRFLIAAAFVLVGTLPSMAQDIPSIPEVEFECGTIQRNNTSSQYGNRQSPWLEYVVETIRSLSGDCVGYVKVDGQVQGVSGSSGTNSGTYVASLKKPIALANWGSYDTESHHYFTWYLKEIDFGTKKSTVNIQPGSEEPPPDDGGAGGGGEEPEPIVIGECYDSECGASPLLLDVAHNGYHLTSVADGVLFDIDGDGILDRVAWTRAESDDAWLALDRNGNGRIDDGTELFGNHTPAYLGLNGNTTANGFEALRFTEGPTYGASGAWDEIIDAKDAVFPRLLLWTDRNHNGISEPDELQPLSAAGVQAIETNYKTARRRDAHGNEFRQRAKAMFNDGEFFIYDVWLKLQR